MKGHEALRLVLWLPEAKCPTVRQHVCSMCERYVTDDLARPRDRGSTEQAHTICQSNTLVFVDCLQRYMYMDDEWTIEDIFIHSCAWGRSHTERRQVKRIERIGPELRRYM